MNPEEKEPALPGSSPAESYMPVSEEEKMKPNDQVQDEPPVSAKKKKKKESKKEKRAKRKEELEKFAPSKFLQPVEEQKLKPLGKVLIVLPLTLPGDEEILYRQVFARLDKELCDVRFLNSNKIKREALELYPGRQMRARRTTYYYKYFAAEMTKYLKDPISPGKVRIVFVNKIHPTESIEKSIAICGGLPDIKMKRVSYKYLGLAPVCYHPIKGYPFSYSHVIYSGINQFTRMSARGMVTDREYRVGYQLRFAKMYFGFTSWEDSKKKFGLNNVILYKSEPKAEDEKISANTKATIDRFLRNANKARCEDTCQLRDIEWKTLEEDWKKSTELAKSIPEVIAFQVAKAAGLPELKLEEVEEDVEPAFDVPADADKVDSDG